MRLGSALTPACIDGRLRVRVCEVESLLPDSAAFCPAAAKAASPTILPTKGNRQILDQENVVTKEFQYLEIWGPGNPEMWRSWGPGNPEICGPKNQKIRILKIHIRSAQNVGKVWISRKNMLLAHFGSI